MNKVITINLDGIAYQLEEGGYEALRNYLAAAAVRLQGNPDKDEILSDIERALGEKFRALLGSHKTVVVEKEVVAALAEMGPIEADTGATADPGARTGAGGTDAPKGGAPGATGGPGPASSGPTPRRLYRIYDDAMISGVCSGIAAYANIDPTLVRLAFVLLTMLGGSGVLVYVVIVILVPEARTAEEKAAASGAPPTAQEFIRRAKEGYYEAMKGFPDRHARREWRRRFKREMRASAGHWQYQWQQNQWQKHWAGSGPTPPAAHPGISYALPFLSVFHGLANVLWVCAMVSLLATGTVFGLALPANVPVWLMAVLLFIAYGILVDPLKATRHACYRGVGRSNWSWSLVFFLDAIVWLMVVGVLICLAVHYFPELREAVQSIPALIHQAGSDIRTWWKGS